MNCESVRRDISLFLYGELSIEDEQELQDHLDGCPECRRALEAERALHQVLDAHELEPAPELLAGCRRELDLRLKLAGVRRVSWWIRLRDALSSGPLHSAAALRRPIGALALIALGFFAARWTSPSPSVILPRENGGEGAVSRIRFVQPDSSGRVQIAVEETRQRVITGRPEDEPIRRLLLAAAREANDPGLRVETIDLLKERPEAQGVRRALLEAVLHDPNPGVRLKALEGLKPFAAQAEVRTMLGRVLLEDQNPGIRIQAIDLLMQQKPEDKMVGVLQELLEKEDNNYVRLRCQRALQEMNASIGTF